MSCNETTTYLKPSGIRSCMAVRTDVRNPGVASTLQAEIQPASQVGSLGVLRVSLEPKPWQLHSARILWNIKYAYTIHL